MSDVSHLSKQVVDLRRRDKELNQDMEQFIKQEIDPRVDACKSRREVWDLHRQFVELLVLGFGLRPNALARTNEIHLPNQIYMRFKIRDAILKKAEEASAAKSSALR